MGGSSFSSDQGNAHATATAQMVATGGRARLTSIQGEGIASALLVFRSGGGTGQLAIGGGGGYGIRRKVAAPNYLPQAQPTQRVHPSGYLYFR